MSDPRAVRPRAGPAGPVGDRSATAGRRSRSRSTPRSSGRCSTRPASEPRTRLLDVGCGSGLTLVLAADARGARHRARRQSGPSRWAARGGCPSADLRLGDLQSCLRRRHVRRRARRQRLPVRGGPGGRVRGRGPRRTAGRARRGQPVRRARAQRVHGDPRGDVGAQPARATVGAPALRTVGARGLERAMDAAGLEVGSSAEVPVDWAYADAEARCAGCSAREAAPAGSRTPVVSRPRPRSAPHSCRSHGPTGAS